MQNLLKSLAITIVAYAIGHYFGGSWVAGIPTGMIAFTASYFIFARNSMNRLTEITKEAMQIVQDAQSSQNPDAMLKGIEQGVKRFERALDLQKEQFLIAEIVHAQIGTLIYQGAALQLQVKMQYEMQNNRTAVQKSIKKAEELFAQAKFHLQKAHSHDWVLQIVRNWQGMGMLAAMEFRDGEQELALTHMDKCKGIGKDDPLFWISYAWMLKEAGKSTDALLAANDGLSKNPSNAGLQHLSDAIANQKVIEPIQFGMMWFSIFPEQLTVDIAMKLQSQMGGEQPQMNRQMRRAMKKKGY